MLFNSYEFIFIFLPITLIGFYVSGKIGSNRAAITWLVGASLFFYGWWNSAYLVLIFFSVLFNYSAGILISSSFKKKLLKKAFLTIGISINLLVLGYFKYSNFFIDNLNNFANTNIVFNEVILPLAISFFTFQQIAYLVDSYKGETEEYNFLHYCLFVTFFPQLIAGPIVHHKEMLPQFAKELLYEIRARNIAIGITIFSIGLFKKVVIADQFSVYATPVFSAADSGTLLTFFEAWGGALAYTFQLYFDFSGYSDMAIGAARMFGIVLPINFNSPYKSTSIIDFWRRWHITLSRFLRNYLYIPLGGNRKGSIRRYINLMLTMLIGGLWHGAGWTFVLWGALHGFYLVINHLWRKLFRLNLQNKASQFLAWIITFFAVVVSWVPFRASNLESALNVFHGMTGINGFVIPQRFFDTLNNFYDFGNYLIGIGVEVGSTPYFKGNPEVLWISIFILMLLPNTQQFIGSHMSAVKIYQDKSLQKRSWLGWRPTITWSIFTAFIFIYSIHEMSNISEFLYFQF